MSHLLAGFAGRAALEALLVSGVGGLVGVHIVLRRMSFFAMALTHATFPGVVLATMLGVNLYLGGGVFGAAIALGVVALSHARGHNQTVATGVGLAAGFALGVVLLSTRNGFTKDLTAFTVGDVLDTTRTDLVITTACVVAVTLVFVALHKELTFVAFDRTGARAAGYPVLVLDAIVFVAVEVVVVTAVPVVGSILTIALLVGPAASARLWAGRFAPTVALAAAIGAGCAVGGVLVSQYEGVAAGGAIAFIDGAVFFLALLAARARDRLVSHRAARPARVAQPRPAP